MRAPSVLRRPRKERLERKVFLSRGTPETERRDYRALAGHFAGEILRNGNIKRSRIPGEQCTGDILVDDPYDLAGAIVKRSQNMRDVDDLSGLIDELAAQRRIRGGIDPLVIDCDNRTRGSLNQRRERLHPDALNVREGLIWEVDAKWSHLLGK